jgi:hypothetical protein
MEEINLDEKLNEVCLIYQDILEASTVNYPSGTCYLAGYCISEFLNAIGLESKSVTGSLAIMSKSGNYLVYGNLKLPKSERIGVYHTWCEVLIDNDWYILDPTLKYNIMTLKKAGIKLNSKIPDVLVTKNKDTFLWKYIEDEKLVSTSNEFLNRANNELKKEIVDYILSCTQ